MSDYSTLLTFPGDGVTTLYQFNFPYLHKDFVKVRVDGEDVGFIFNNDNMVQLYGPAPVGSIVTVSRETDADRLVNFADGAALLASSLNIADTQVMHLLQEEKDRTSVSFQYSADGEVSISGRTVRVTPAQALFLLQQIGDVSEDALNLIYPDDISDFTSALDNALSP